MPRCFGPFFQILEFGSKAQGLPGTCHQRLVFQKYLKDNGFKFKIQRWTLSLNSSIQPKARGLLHMECDCSSHPIYEDYFSRLQDYSSKEHHAASVQPKEVLGRQDLGEVQRSRRQLLKYSDDCTIRLQRARGLVRPGAT